MFVQLTLTEHLLLTKTRICGHQVLNFLDRQQTFYACMDCHTNSQTEKLLYWPWYWLNISLLRDRQPMFSTLVLNGELVKCVANRCIFVDA
ncbi:hypothetical protein [Nostoc sp. CCY0012]|uniref:hypothetical protein n=1 Tax=Nostoc sp. CCY0012 TaxID=1056123 RepID=UPI0039C5D882